jgi:putative ABC transport system substrate-binding protein
VAPLRAQNVAVVMSSDASAYQEALEGFKETTRHRIVGVQTLKDNPASWHDEIKKLRSKIEPDLVFVIGTSALQAVAGEITNIPVVHAMAFNPFAVANSSAKNITSISMIPAVNQSISLLKELNPKYRRVGVMFDPNRSGPLFSQARTVAQKENLQLIAREIRSPGEIAGALKSLENEIDVLWLWPDEAFLADDILQRIFLFSFERKIPVLGLSERHTQMGAVLSLSYGNAKDMGRQAGEVANKLLGDIKVASVPAIPLRETKLTVNLKTAHKLGVDVPDSIIQRADNAVKAPVYKEGDWWVFRINMIDPSGATKTEVHRVMFNNDKFASDDPSFLSGGDVAGTPYFLPFASVYLTDPARRWLDFPLVAGKKWSFRYRVRGGGFAGGPRFSFKSADADAEVIGKASHPIETAAGKFVAIEIGRTDNVGGILAYYYSPQSQSVVKLRARGSGYQKGQYELELIAYGNGGNMGKDLR